MAVLVVLLRHPTLAHIVRAYSDEVDKENNEMHSCSKKVWQVEVSPKTAELALRFCNQHTHLARAAGGSL